MTYVELKAKYSKKRDKLKRDIEFYGTSCNQELRNVVPSIRKNLEEVELLLGAVDKVLSCTELGDTNG